MVAVTFLHLDLGIGGAERLIVDAAVALKNKNHSINIITTHHDRSHCFTETKDGTLPVTVVGDWLPRNVFGKFAALCAYIRLLYAAMYLVFFSRIKTDIAVCDQISVCVPILRYKIAKIVYYCHFPDLLLSQPGGVLKQVYRMPLNLFEEKTTDMADVILVNSEFTKNTFRNTFKSIRRVPDVLYPSINDKLLQNIYENCDKVSIDPRLNDCEYFVSVNRYERKKNIKLALEAFGWLQRRLNPEPKRPLKLVIAGGYDSIVQENLSYFEELLERAKELEIEDDVIFLKSPSDTEKIKLIKNSLAVIYTPDNEHFGIVPLEAMFCSKPVVAVNSGGPKETVLHGETGFLCCPTSNSFSAAMLELVSSKELPKKMGEAARERYLKNFSFDAFANKLENVIV